MRRKIKVLHLASFTGNIGDFANHQGFYKKFKSRIPSYFFPLEIRKFYRNRAEMNFDDSFVKLVNKYDMLVLGGGGFFDLKWDNSHTGTTIDFSEKIINNIKVPVLVNGMGYHEYENPKKGNIEKFGNFWKIITDNPNWLITIRNDGSFDRLKYRYGDYVNKVYKVPDNGFYFNPKKHNRLLLDCENNRWVGFNITNDLFSKDFNKNVDVNFFNESMSKFINFTLEKNSNVKIVLFPHTNQDVVTIGQILSGLEGKYKREKIVIAPLVNEGESIEYLFDLYRVCSCVVAMRFHANVCCIGMNIPTIGLAGHEQISSLYKEIRMPERCVKIDNKNFCIELESKLSASIKNIGRIKSTYKKVNIELNRESDIYFAMIKDFVEKKYE